MTRKKPTPTTTSIPAPEVREKLRILCRQAAQGDPSAEWFRQAALDSGWYPPAPKKTYTVRDIATIFDVTERAVRYWMEDGCPRNPDGSLDLESVLRWYMNDRENLTGETKTQMDAAKLKKAIHEAEILEIAEERKRLDFESERAKWIGKDEVEEGAIRRRQALKAVLGKLTKELPRKLEHRPGREIQAVLEERVTQLLTRLSGGTP